jgi:hypothetical protein
MEKKQHYSVEKADEYMLRMPTMARHTSRAKKIKCH